MSRTILAPAFARVSTPRGRRRRRIITIVDGLRRTNNESTQCVQWKTQLLDGAMGVFLTPGEQRESQGPSVKEMQAKIGRLALENDFLAGALGRIDGASAKK